MKTRMLTNLMTAAAMVGIMLASSAALAKNGGASKSRLLGEVESDAGIAGCKYMAKGDRYRLVFFAEGFAEGDEFDAALNGQYAGSMIVEFDPVEQVNAAELDLRSRGGDMSMWVAEIPLNVAAGSICTLTNKTAGGTHSATLEPK